MAICLARAGIVPLVLLVATSIAHALPADFERCTGIDDDNARLACYDAASGRAQPKTSPVEPQAQRQEPPATGGAPPAAQLTPPAHATMLEKAWALEADSDKYLIDLYRPNYLLFARWTDNTNTQPSSSRFPASAAEAHAYDSVEAKFQISFRARLWAADDRRWGVWAAYTQQSQWQVYNANLSRPFRETNYMPEVMVTYAPRQPLGAGLQWSVLNVGLNHQSNGQSDPLSRSWNRIIAEFGVERGDFALLVRPWYRIKEPADRDDNADITDYYGYGDLTAVYKWRGHTFTAMARGNVHTGKGAAQLTWSTPRLGPIRGYVQLFSGYGESLIDYNWRQTTIGAGIALNDLLPDR
jgi:phospholipase A1